MKLNEVIAQIRSREPAALGKMPDPHAMRVLRAGLAAIHGSIVGCEDGKVVVQGLGMFLVRKRSGVDGGKESRIVRFVASKPAPAPKAKVKAKGK